jgi:hypothetical protein
VKETMSEIPVLDRRQMLQTTTGFLAGLVLAGSPLAAIAKGRAWAIELTALSSSEAATLAAMTRTMFPHDKLEDIAYAKVVQAIDEDSRKDEGLLRLLKAGVRDLPPDFAKLPESARVAALTKIEAGEFFRTMRLKTVQRLYASPMAYACFGYQGESFSEGGYLLRGFNDLHWLPEVPLEDSGPLPF